MPPLTYDQMQELASGGCVTIHDNPMGLEDYLQYLQTDVPSVRMRPPMVWSEYSSYCRTDDPKKDEDWYVPEKDKRDV